MGTIFEKASFGAIEPYMYVEHYLRMYAINDTGKVSLHLQNTLNVYICVICVGY